MLSASALAQDQIAVLRFFGKEAGFDQGLIRAMMEDEGGFLWTLTSNSIHRFDGSKVLRYGEEEPLLENSE
ncbi:MAG: hypothetical protein AAFR67_10870, partial [Chloroflexota bacterium]